MIEDSLMTLLNPNISDANYESAIDQIQTFIVDGTSDFAYLPPSELTDRIRDTLTQLMNRKPTRDASRLIWLLGRIDDGTLAEDYRRWLQLHLHRTLDSGAAIHQLLVNMDCLGRSPRNASITELDENIRRARVYLDDSTT